MKVKNNTIKFISIFLIISIISPIILLSFPKKITAFWGVSDVSVGDVSAAQSAVSNAATAGTGATSAGANVTTSGATVSGLGISVKTWYGKILDQVLMAVARKVLQEITKSTVSWINGGFHGSPLFLENSSSFFEDIVKSEVKGVVDTFGYDSIRFPYGKGFAINTINAYKRTLEDNLAYSLSKVMTDQVQLNNYRHNFDVGGWNAFLVNTQYPQNNYLGFQMMANEQLALKVTVSPTANNAITKVKETLQQGMGFLSPQTCPSNSEYNNGTNEFQRPSFDYTKLQKWYTEEGKKITDKQMSQEDKETAFKLLNEQYKIQAERQKGEWAKKNTCPGGLVATTPGSVVSSQITNALGSNFRQSELGAAMGNSLSSIFDALLNKFLDPEGGLLGLASNKNTKPAEDDWSYNGLTLGSPADGNNSSWDIGPDEEIILDKFKKELSGKTIVTTVKADGSEEVTEEIGNTTKPGDSTRVYVPGDIANTETESILIEIMPKIISNTDINNPGIIQLTQSLDECTPGPNKEWEERLAKEVSLAERQYTGDATSQDELKVRAAEASKRELKFAVLSFKDWLITKMISELPGSVLYLDAIKTIDTFAQQQKELTDLKRTKTQTIARLKAFEVGLNTILKQPAPTDPDFEVKEKELIAIRKQYNAIKSTVSSSVTIESIRSDLDTLNDKVKNLKELNSRCKAERVAKGWEESGGRESKQNNFTELEKFCSIPVVSGYSHGSVIRVDDAARTNNCTKPNYCKNWPTEKYADWFHFRSPYIDRSKNPSSPNEPFVVQPADLGQPGYQDLPLLNAQNVLGDIRSCGFLGLGSCNDLVNINIDCKVIFNSMKTDYTHAGELDF